METRFLKTIHSNNFTYLASIERKARLHNLTVYVKISSGDYFQFLICLTLFNIILLSIVLSRLEVMLQFGLNSYSILSVLN